MSKFAEETLFYIFYAMPQDVLQDAAAYELYSLSSANILTTEHVEIGVIIRESRCG